MNKETKRIKIGITGSTGVVGAKLIEMFLNYDADITCLVRQNSNIEFDKSKVRIVYGDLNNIPSVKTFVSDLDVCIHLAAQVNLTQKDKYYQINVAGTENICKMIADVNPDCRLINCSSVAAYRITGLFRAQFTDYAKSKREADRVVSRYQSERGLKAATIVPGMIYGPGKNKFIPTVIDYLKGKNVYFVTGGEKNAPLTYLDDLCDLFVKAAYNSNSAGNRYFAFNCNDVGIHEFIQMIADKASLKIPKIKKFPKSMLMIRAILSEYFFKMFNKPGNPKYTKRMVDILSINYQPSDGLLENNLNWTPKVDAKTGLKNCFDWYEKPLTGISE